MKYYTHEDILRLEHGSRILVDSGAEASKISSWYKDHVYEKRTFAQLDTSYLNSVKENLTNFLNLLSRKEISTVSRVVAEIARFKEKIHEKLEHMILKENNPVRRFKNQENKNYGREVFEEIMLVYKEMHRIASKSIFAPRNPKFEGLVKAMDIISSSSSSIKDYGLRYGDEHTRRSEDLHADEELVAAAIYNSLEQNPSAIITGDSDLSILLQNAIRFLGNLKNSKSTLDYLRTHSIHIYFVSSEGLKCAADSAELVDRTFFNLPNRDYKHLARIKPLLEDHLEPVQRPVLLN